MNEPEIIIYAKGFVERNQGHLSLDTIIAYYKIYRRYTELKNDGKTHIEASTEAGSEPRNMYRIIKVFEV